MLIKSSTSGWNDLLSVVTYFKGLVKFSGKGLRKHTEKPQTEHPVSDGKPNLVLQTEHNLICSITELV
jgi:hypothetical protein